MTDALTSQTRKRIVPFIILAAFYVLIWLAFLRPLSDWSSARFAEYHAVSSELEDLKQRISALDQERQLISLNQDEGLAWEAIQLGEASARVQAAINTLAETSNVSIRSLAPSDARNASFANGVAFRIEVEASLDELMNFFLLVENSKPALLTEKVVLRRLNRFEMRAPMPLIFSQIDLSAPITLRSEVDE